MAKKVELEEKKIKNKTETNKKVKDSKNSTKNKKEVNKVKETKVVEKVKVDNVVVNQASPVDNTKRNKIIKAVIYSLIAVIVIGAFIYSLVESSGNDKYFNTVNFNEATQLINDDELNIIYWASPSCGYCVQFTPIVKEVSIEKSVKFNYLNAANISNEDYATLMGYVGSFDETYSTGLGTPSLILVKDGKVVDISVGAQSKTDLVNYLTTKGFIK